MGKAKIKMDRKRENRINENNVEMEMVRKYHPFIIVRTFIHKDKTIINFPP